MCYNLIMKHNNSGYGQGCRCDECRKGHREAASIHRATPKAKETLKKWRRDNKEHIREYNSTKERKDYLAKHNKVWMKTHRAERNEYMKEWRASHPNLVKATAKKSRLKNSDKIHKSNLANYAKNRTKRIRDAVAWAKTKKGKLSKKVTKHNRRAAKGKSTPKQWESRWEMYGGLCWICHQPATETDHVIPLNKKGTNWPANLRPICRKCNASKGDKLIRLA